MIVAKYGAGAMSSFPKVVESSRASRIWADIMQVGKRWPEFLDFFKSNVQLKVGDGKDILFWRDRWMGERALKEEFPRLYMLSSDKEKSLFALRRSEAGSSGWTVSFRRRLRGWEVDEFGMLGSRIAVMLELKAGVADFTSWSGSNTGVFTTNQAYQWWLVGQEQNLDVLHFIWNSSAPFWVQCFCWLVVLGRIKSADLLLKFGVI